MRGDEVLPRLADVDDLRGGRDPREVAALAAADRILPCLEQPDRVGQQPPEPDDREIGRASCRERVYACV